MIARTHTLDASTVESLEALSDELDMSKSALIRCAVKQMAADYQTSGPDVVPDDGATIDDLRDDDPEDDSTDRSPGGDGRSGEGNATVDGGADTTRSGPDLTTGVGAVGGASAQSGDPQGSDPADEERNSSDEAGGDSDSGSGWSFLP